MRDSFAQTVDAEDGDRVDTRRSGTRSVASERLGNTGGLQHGGFTRSAFSEWLENASFTDGVSTDAANDVGDSGEVSGELLQRGEGNDPMFPLHGEFGRPTEILLERGPNNGKSVGDSATPVAKRLRTGETTGTGETDRFTRNQAKNERRLRYVRRTSRRILRHFRTARELLEELQWSVDSEESESSKTD